MHFASITTFLILIAYNITAFSSYEGVKVLHLTLHEGCQKDFEEVARELNLSITSWFLHDIEKNRPGCIDGNYIGAEIYNIGPQRAKRIWDKHKNFFNTFDVIVTSDTAPLSRIFLQNGWKKPLIIWVCNRFDYAHGNGGEEHFPDGDYYKLIRQATHMPNVRIVSYTEYEHVYARRKGIEFGSLTIKPLGRKTERVSHFDSSIPASVNKPSTLFLYPRLDPTQLDFIQSNCKQHGISTYSGVYNGPHDLEKFIGIIYFPYQWSNLALFEGIQRGIIHFVPSERFVLDNRHTPIRYTTLSEFNLCEWYAQDNRQCIVYFDSWNDLKQKIKNTDYTNLKQAILQTGVTHRNTMLDRWKQVFKAFRF